MNDDYIRKRDAVNYCKALMNAELVQHTHDWGYGRERYNQTEVILNFIENCQPADVVPVVYCRDCKHFELNPVTVVDGIPLILAHEICNFWGNGCKTSQDSFCSYGEKREE